MRRLAATLGCDVRVQHRNGFYWAVVFVLSGFAVLLTLVRLDWSVWMPPIVLGNLMVGTFYFMGGLMLLERGEGTLEALVVTPLVDGEYLASKLLTLTALGVVEHVTLALLATGFGFSVAPLLGGLVCGSLIYCLFGFLAVSRYDSINEYLFPSVVYTAFLSIPLLVYFELAGGWLFYLHPLQGTLVLLEGAFVEPLTAARWAYAVGSSLLWIGLLGQLSRLWFHRFVVHTAGAR